MAENTPEREIDEALQKHYEAWREEQELIREGYEERAEEDLAMVREFDGVARIAELEARVKQLEEAAKHVRDELYFQAHAGYSYEKRVYFSQLSQVLDEVLPDPRPETRQEEEEDGG